MTSWVIQYYWWELLCFRVDYPWWAVASGEFFWISVHRVGIFNIPEKFAWVKGKSKHICWGYAGRTRVYECRNIKLLSDFQPQWAMSKRFEAAGFRVGVSTVLLMTIQKSNPPVHSTGTFWTFEGSCDWFIGSRLSVCGSHMLLCT